MIRWLRPRWWLCMLAGHPLSERGSVRYLGPAGVQQVDEWQSCHCGQRKTSVTRTRIRPPYPERQP